VTPARTVERIGRRDGSARLLYVCWLTACLRLCACALATPTRLMSPRFCWYCCCWWWWEFCSFVLTSFSCQQPSSGVTMPKSDTTTLRWRDGGSGNVVRACAIWTQITWLPRAVCDV